MSDQTITLKVTGDTSGLPATTNAVKQAVNEMGQAGAAAGAQTASGFDKASQAAQGTASSVGKAGQAAQQAGAQGQQAGAQIASGMQQAATGTDLVAQQMGALRNTALALVGLSFGKRLAEDAMEISDEYANIQAKIRLTTDTTAQQVAVSKQLFQISQETGSAWDNNTKLYQRMFQAEQSAGLATVDAQTKALALTEEITKIMITSGATAQEAKFAIQDLSHGLAEGHIQWRQLSAMMRESPQLAKTLADGLGVPIGKLKELAQQGQITTKAFTDAMLSQGQAVDAQFAKMPLTFARAFQQFSNSMTQYIGQSTDGSVATNLLKEAIVGLGNNIGTVMTLATSAGAVFAAMFAGDVINKVTAWGTTLVQQYLLARAQTQAYAADKLFEAEADLKAAQAATLENTAIVTGIKARQDLLAQKVLDSAATVELAKTQLQAATTAEEQQAAQVMLNKALIEGRAAAQALVATDAELVAAETALATSKRNLTAATAATGAAQLEVAATTSILGAAWNGLKSVGTGLLTLLGGWPGVLVAAGIALYTLSQRHNDLNDAIAATNKQADELKAKVPDLQTAFSAWGTGAKTAAEQTQASMDKQRAALVSLVDTTQSKLEAWVNLLNRGTTGFLTSSDMARLKIQELDKAQANLKFQEMVNGIKNVSDELQRMIFGSKEAAAQIHEAVSKSIEEIDKETIRLKAHTIELQQGKVAALDMKDAQERIALATKESGTQLQQDMVTLIAHQLKRREATQADDEATKSKKAYTAAVKEESKTLKDAQSDYDKANQLADQFNQSFGTQEQQAVRQYNKEIETLGNGQMALAPLLASNKITLEQYNQKWKEYSDLAALSYDREQERLAQIKEQHDLFSQANRDLDEAILLAQTEESQRKAVTEAYKAYNAALKSGHDFNGIAYSDQQALTDALKQQLPQLIAQRQGIENVSLAMQRQDDISKQWVSIFANAFNNIGDGFAKVASDALFHFKSIDQTFKDLGKALTDTAAQLVQSIIAMFAKLAVINPMLNAIFGTAAGGGKLLPTLDDAGGLVGMLLGNGSAAGGEAAGSAGGSALSTGFSIIGLASKLFGGGGASSGGSSLGGLGSISNIGSSLSNMGGMFNTFWNGSTMSQNMLAQMPGAYQTPYGGYSSGLGQGLGIASGIYAGWNRAQNADGAFGKVGGGLAYGVGTYALGAGLSSAAAGTGFAAGAGALGPVGWVALAAMLIDKFSGGNLFGTSFQPNGETKQNFNYTGDDSSLVNSYEEKKKSALFGGNKYRWVTMDTTQDQKDQVAAFVESMNKVRQSAADALAISMADVVTGAFQQRWNKDGKVTEEVSTVLGQTYKETMDKFVERVQSENVLAAINKAAGTTEATDIAAKYRANADDLANVAQLLLQAESDIKKGQNLLKDDTSLKDVVDEVNKLAVSNETMLQTYQRLVQESDVLQSSLDLMGVNINKTGAAFVEFADSAAKAAGGLNNLQQLFSTYQTEFYSGDEIAKLQLAAYKKASDQALASIGEASDVSLSKFRSDFEAAMPTLTPEQLVQWLNASSALYNATQAQGEWNAKLATEAALVKASGDLLQASLDAMHVSIGKVGQDFTDLATQIATSAGGLDAASQLWSDYFSSFYSDVERAQLQAKTAKSAAGGALTAIGEDPNVSMAQFRKDFEAALPTLSADQIVAWLKAGELLTAATAAQNAYNKALADSGQAVSDVQYAFQGTNAEAKAFLQSLGVMGGTLTPYQQSMQDIATQTQKAIAAANQLAQANGQVGASSYQLAQIQMWAADQQAKAAQQLQQTTMDLVSQLYGGVPGSLDEINKQIAALEASTKTFGGAVGSVGSAANSASQLLQQKIALQLGSLSPLNDNEKLAIAKQAYLEGNASAEDVLNIAQRLYASSADYKQVFDWVLANQKAQTGTGTTGGAGGGTGGGVSPDLQALYAARDKLIAQQLADQRKALAEQLASNIGDLAKQNHIDALAQMALLGVKLDKLVEDFGINLKDQTAKTITGLSDLAGRLGINFGDLVKALGLNFGDLKVGFMDLAKQMGIDITNLTGESIKGLSDITSALKIGLPDLLDGLGLKMTDVKGAIVQYLTSLGVDLNNLTVKSVQSMVDLSTKFNISLGDLAKSLDVPLSQFTPAIKQMAADMHIDLSTVGDKNGNGLAALAAKLNISLSDLASILGIKIDATTGAVNAARTQAGVSVDQVLASHAQTRSDIGVRFTDTGTRLTSIDTTARTGLATVDTSVRTVDNGISSLPARMPVTPLVDTSTLVQTTNAKLDRIIGQNDNYMYSINNRIARVMTATESTSTNTDNTRISVDTMSNRLDNTIRSGRVPGVTP